MLSYDLSPQDREALRPHDRAVLALIAIRANAALGRPDVAPRGIYKPEGGVVVNGREIAIMRDYVADDWKPQSDRPTPEEVATVAAIHSVRDDCNAKKPSLFDGVIERVNGLPLKAMLLE